MNGTRIAEFSSAISFISIMIGLGMYVVAFAEWLVAVPLFTGAIFAFVAWAGSVLLRNIASIASISILLSDGIPNDMGRVIQFTSESAGADARETRTGKDGAVAA